MKYWLFQNNQVYGPYDPEELGRLPGYSLKSLVCPERSKGTVMGDWQRAGLIPDLVSSAPQKAAQPPEFAQKDISLLNVLQEKVALLENMATQLQESLRAKETEMLGLRRELDSRQALAGTLQAKIQGIEERLAAIAQLRETVDGAVAAEKNVESSVNEVKNSVTGVSTMVKEFEGALEDQRRTVADLLAKLDASKAAQSAVTAPAPEQLVKEPPPILITVQPRAEPAPLETAQSQPAPEQKPVPSLEQLVQEPPQILITVQPRAEPAPLETAQPQPAPEQKPVPSLEQLVQEPPPILITSRPQAEPAPLETAQPQPAPDQKPAPLPFFDVTPATKEMPELNPVVIPALTLPSKPKSRKKAWILSLAAFGVAALIALIFLAMPTQAPKPPEPKAAAMPAQPVVPAPTPATPAAATPATPQAPQTPSPEAQLDELKHQAISLVQSWPTFDKAVTVGQRLEPKTLSEGNLLPWMVENLKDDSFQVNFYGRKSTDGKQAFYSFQAGLGEKTVSPLNAAAKVLLLGEPVPAKPKKIRVRRKKAKKEPAANQAASPTTEIKNPHMPGDAPAQKPEDAQLDKLLNP